MTEPASLPMHENMRMLSDEKDVIEIDDVPSDQTVKVILDK